MFREELNIQELASKIFSCKAVYEGGKREKFELVFRKPQGPMDMEGSIEEGKEEHRIHAHKSGSNINFRKGPYDYTVNLGPKIDSDGFYGTGWVYKRNSEKRVGKLEMSTHS